MLQCWATAFANKPEYKIVVDTPTLMKLAAFDFPSLKEADAMFMAQVAPEWADGPECYRCRSIFTVFTRKHHCRACGQIFCDKCSSREMALPQFGIEKEVRVCETCYEKKVAEIKERYPALKKQLAAAIAGKKGVTPTSGDSEADRAAKEKLLREKEEEDLALAIAISQSEAEAKEKEKQANMYSLYNGIKPETDLGGYKGAAEPSTAPPPDETSSDPLARYLNRDYWQQKKEGKLEEWAASSTTGALSATAPPPSEPSIAPSICSTLMGPDENSLNAEIAAMSLGVSNGLNNSVGDDAKAQADDTMRWCQSIKDQVSVMDNRIRSNLARGRPVFNDSAIQDLFTRLTEFHSHVLSRMHTLDEQRGYYEGLQDHLANIGEARQAIDEMRDEHERKRQERLAEEQRLRQAQMQQTLEMMRMKKHVSSSVSCQFFIHLVLGFPVNTNQLIEQLLFSGNANGTTRASASKIPTTTARNGYASTTTSLLQSSNRLWGSSGTTSTAILRISTRTACSKSVPTTTTTIPAATPTAVLPTLSKWSGSSSNSNNHQPTSSLDATCSTIPTTVSRILSTTGLSATTRRLVSSNVNP